MVKQGDKYRLYTDDPSAVVPEVVAYAQAHDLRVIALNTMGPSLEDVFLQVTGQQVGTMRHDAADKQPRRGRGRRGGGK